MPVVVVGLSHRTVPLDLLERMSVPRDRMAKALADIQTRPFIAEAVVLSTCHRTEVYVAADRFHGAVQDVRHFLSELAFVPPEDFSDHLYSYYDDAAVAHLFGVAAGLDSVVLGESQVLGQVREAWLTARAEGAAGPRLSALFRHALEVGKRARAETAIGRGVTSLSQAAVAMARQRLGTLAGKRLLVVGAGKMGEGVVADLAGPGGAEQVLVANRTWKRAEALAERVGGQAVPLGELAGALAGVDLAFFSATGPDVLLHLAAARGAVEQRSEAPLLLIDLGMPRNVDHAVADLRGVTLIDLDGLEAFARAGLDQRRKEVVPVRAIVADEVARFLDATTAREAAPTVAALHDWAERHRSAEVERYQSRLRGLDDRQRDAVEALTRGIVAKILHDPTIRLKDAAGSDSGDRLTAALRELFDL